MAPTSTCPAPGELLCLVEAARDGDGWFMARVDVYGLFIGPTMRFQTNGNYMDAKLYMCCMRSLRQWNPPLDQVWCEQRRNSEPSHWRWAARFTEVGDK